MFLHLSRHLLKRDRAIFIDIHLLKKKFDLVLFYLWMD
jgi:hypothetical protein